MTANRALDETFGGEDGVSPIRFGRRDADQVLGHLQNHHSRDGRRPRFHRYRLPLDLPEPYEHDVWLTVREVVAGVLIMGGLFLGLLFWVAIAAASQAAS